MFRPFDHDEEFRISIKYHVAAAFRGCMPVEPSIIAAPLRATAKFVAQVSSHNPFLISVAQYDGPPIGEPFFFGIISAVPETVAIVVLATPVCPANMIVQNSHDTGAC